MTRHEPLGRRVRVLARRARPLVMRTGRLTLAATTAFLVLHALYPSARPLTGPLTALLVVQATLFATLTSGVRRVLSVVSGVFLAVGVSALVGLTWWSLAMVIATSLVVGQLLRLGDNLLEVPISAMLVLGLWSPQSAALSRVVRRWSARPSASW